MIGEKMPRNPLSILARARPSDLRRDPFPYVVVEEALEPELFQRLNAELPSAETVMQERAKADTWYAYPACRAVHDPDVSPLWKEFMQYHCSHEFYSEFLELFSDALDQYYPDLNEALPRRMAEHTVAMRQPNEDRNPENLSHDVSLECQFYVNFTEKPRQVRGPHIDRPSELFAGLLYFRREDDTSSGGNLEVCRAVDRDDLFPSKDVIRVDHLPMEVPRDRIEVAETIAYKPNTLVLFLNTFKSLHSISVRSATPVPRRHINFTADMFTLPPPGLFTVRYPKSKQLKKWLTKQPVAWRLAQLIDD